MAEAPERCPTCMTQVPEGASRCPGCGRVFGESNRCPHCHAIAAVRQSGKATVCAACGKPRSGAVVMGKGAVGQIVPSTRRGRDQSTTEMLERVSGRSRRLLGVLTIALALFAATAAPVLVGGAFGYLLAALAAVLGIALGAAALRSGGARLRSADRHGFAAREAAIWELAEEEGGRLTVKRVAERYGLSAEEADAALTQLVGDGSRVNVEVDDDGRLEYVFFELIPSPAVKVRVAPADEQEPFEIESESAAEEERTRKA